MNKLNHLYTEIDSVLFLKNKRSFYCFEKVKTMDTIKDKKILPLEDFFYNSSTTSAVGAFFVTD